LCEWVVKGEIAFGNSLGYQAQIDALRLMYFEANLRQRLSFLCLNFRNAKHRISGRKYRDWRANWPASRVLKTTPAQTSSGSMGNDYGFGANKELNPPDAENGIDKSYPSRKKMPGYHSVRGSAR
jgi:hypothetical protein